MARGRGEGLDTSNVFKEEADSSVAFNYFKYLLLTHIFFVCLFSISFRIFVGFKPPKMISLLLKGEALTSD